MECPHCHQPIAPILSMDEFQARAEPRLQAIEILAAKIDFSSYLWKLTVEGERYERLMQEQLADEVAAGL